jgi:formate/nitrite transporter
MPRNDADPARRVLDELLFDAYAPPEIAKRIERVGVAKAALALVPLLGLSVLAGAFIAFGAMLYTVTVTGSGLGFGLTRVVGGIAFSLGLIMVLVGGAELFTGNALIVMGWAGRKVGTRALLRNWSASYAGNLVGALAMAVAVHWSGVLRLADGAVGATAIAVAAAKVALPFEQAFVRGVLCNVLVCHAVWLCFAARGVGSKIFAIVFPIAAFVALGFEHSIANMYFIPVAWLAAGDPALAKAAGLSAEALGPAGFWRNQVPVALGNVVGGGALVALTYYVIYLRGRE